MSSRDREERDAARERIATLERDLADATEVAKILKSECVARQIREADLSKRLLEAERKFIETRKVIQRQVYELAELRRAAAKAR